MSKIRSHSNCIVLDNIPFVNDVIKLGEGKYAYVDGTRVKQDDDNNVRRKKRERQTEEVETAAVEQL